MLHGHIKANFVNELSIAVQIKWAFRLTPIQKLTIDCYQ